MTTPINEPAKPVLDETVERVAIAIGQTRQDNHPDYGLHQRLSWDEQMRAARAAIAALSQPTKGRTSGDS